MSLPAQAEKVIVYSDVPPLGEEGVSMSVLAHRIIQALGEDVGCVITRVYSNKYDRALIGQGVKAPVLLSWDCGGLGLRFVRGRCRRLLDRVLLRWWLKVAGPRPATRVKFKEIIGLSGPHWPFLLRLRDMARDRSLPYSVYVIDDYEITAAHAGRADNLDICKRIVAECLREARQVFAISPGMAERLKQRYGITSRVLYPIADLPPVDFPNPAAVRAKSLVYVGSLGPAYIDTLVATARTLAGHPQLDGWTLVIVSHDRRSFERHLSVFACVTGLHDCDRNDLRREVARAEAILIPYSFAEEWAVTAATSFPSKFMDAVGAAKPIVVFSPPYSSISRHMAAHHADYIVNDTDDLLKLLASRPWLDNQDWARGYRDLLTGYHSTSSARTILLS